MNKNSNAYIIFYATVMVVVVALVLTFASLSLKERQDANVVNEMKGAILISIGQGADMDKVKDKTEYINSEYAKYITESFAVNAAGEITDEADAFELLRDLKAVYDRDAADRVMPVFVSRSDDGTIRYVLPVRGSGLWGPVWGYIALENDWETIYGVVFDHASETPGLGAEIATESFQGQFPGKKIFSGGDFVGITVLKGAGSSSGNQHAVDAVSGGTITSRAVEDMIKKCLAGYAPFIAKQQSSAGNPAVEIDDVNLNFNEDENE